MTIPILPHVPVVGLMHRIEHLQVQFKSFYPGAKALREDAWRRMGQTRNEQWNDSFVREFQARKR